MELHIKDRFYIPQILPAKNSFLEFNLKKNILNKLAFKEGEREKFNITENTESGKIEWDYKKDFENPIEVDFTEDEVKYLKKSCEEISETACLDDMWVTVEKIYNL